jgi:UDP-N-acetylmuramoyl-L-alanyl-D-glutamate--2,6-diaminopimelate ligase
MFASLKKKFPHHHPLRLFYHKVKAIMAALWYRFPAESMTVIAVTGTNGKTTTCHLITDILREAGHKVGMITTADFRIDHEVVVNEYKMTTLSPFVFQQLLRRMVDRGCAYAVVEVTSHAMDQSRLWGVNVDVALLTNISHDHLDYHGDIPSYIEAKGKLFNLLNHARRKPNVPKISILNGDDPAVDYFQQFVADRTYIYGLKKGSFQASNLEMTQNGTKFLFKIPNHEFEIQLPLPGRFNVENALAAATVGVVLQLNLNVIERALKDAKSVPGRLERIDEGQGYAIVVDYAHAPDSLEKLLSMFRELTPQRLIVVFGATGDRDRSKRPIMGQIVDRYADVVVLTDDDPYTEDRLEILEQVAKGIPRQEGAGFWQIPERHQAIRLALAMARSGDTVIIAGKGCEPFQVVGTEKIPSDDREIVRNFLGRQIEIEIEPGKVERGNRYFES